MNQVKAKFKCNCVTDYGTQKQAVFSAVYSQDSEENSDFTNVTPYGELKININSEAPASGFFKPSENYYLTFSNAPK